MVNLRLTWLLERYEFISNFQVGSRRTRSTTDALVQLETAILNSFAKREHLYAIFFDIQKAFDDTWRYGILKKLHSLQIRGNLPIFIQSFLNDRKFAVRIGNTYSSERVQLTGVPQGSALSVTLFSIAIDDLLTSISPTVGKSLYVDDLLIYSSGAINSNINDILQNEIDKISNNAKKIGFRFSPTKTHVVHFCRLRSFHEHLKFTLDGHTIEVKDNIKFLGVIFDSKLYWKGQIENLSVKCKKALNILRCVSHLSWGADREVLLRLHKALILSKIDYSSVIISGTRATRIQKVNRIHCEGLRLCTGAFRTSRLEDVCCESGIPPMKILFDINLLKYGIRINALRSHPNYNVLFNNDTYPIYDSRSTIMRPTGIRLLERSRNLNLLELPIETYQNKVSEIPPWVISKPQVNYKWFDTKKDTNKQYLKQEFLSVLDQYRDYIIIYTDGSKTEEGVGSAFSVTDKTYNWSLPKYTSVYTAELYAIMQALYYSTMSTEKRFLICSDSLSSLKSITNTFSKDALVRTMLSCLDSLQRRRKIVKFLWCPSHCGIRGNELADSAAREATLSKEIDWPRVRADDVKMEVLSRIRQFWMTQWFADESFFSQIKVGVNTWKIPRELSRREQVALTRLRLGHSNITSSHLLLGAPSPLCVECNEPLNVTHMLLTCGINENLRIKHKISKNLKECLGNDEDNIRKLIAFIKETKIVVKV
ncbi:uncharacterized protein LOC116167099 [Photinus pyralis]|uniref:uncharacterized protein LOC116167099 n=1 Tax=Photinus pyralis TaxID=7054 RepID=UPI001266ECAF|nr:uncharacterized protein LOC116167099 [Photinus pyralis]